MTLWNIIRDFFVQNIFGGTLSSGVVRSDDIIGKGFDGTTSFSIKTTDYFVSIGNGKYLGNSVRDVSHLALGDWLSTTFTVITLILLVFFLYLFVKWIFKLFAGLLSH